MARIDIDSLTKADTLVYKYSQTNLEKNMEIYSKYGYFVIAEQNGKYAGHTMALGTTKLNKKAFKGLKTSLFKKDVNVQLYFVRPTFMINCALDYDVVAAAKNAHFRGAVDAKLELSDPEKLLRFVQRMGIKESGVIFNEATFAGFLIGSALDEMISKGSIHPFVHVTNIHGGGNREAYVANLAFRVYFKPEKINRYASIGLRARSIEVDAKELAY